MAQTNAVSTTADAIVRQHNNHQQEIVSRLKDQNNSRQRQRFYPQRRRLSTIRRISSSTTASILFWAVAVMHCVDLINGQDARSTSTTTSTTINNYERHDKATKDKDGPPPPPERVDNSGFAANNRLDPSKVAPFDKDIRDDCRSLLVHCQSDVFAHVFLQCPASCTAFLQEEGMKGTATSNPDALYDVGTLRTYQGTRVEADRFEGYVLVVAIVPLLPGMAVYYYEMMEHLHTVFDPHVEFVLIPMDLGHGIHIPLRRRKDGKVVVLEEESVTTALESHAWIRHLSSIRPRSGLGTNEGAVGGEVRQRPIQTDRATFYIVSADGYYVESLIAPTMALLQQKITIYQKTLDYDL